MDIDADGDGIIDFTTNGNPTFTPGKDRWTLSLTYNTPWTYQSVVTVTDSLSNVTTHKLVFKVYDPVPMNQMFTDLWARMKDKLRAGDIPAALTSITGGMRSKYQTVFTALQPNLASTVDQLGTLSSSNLGIDMSEYVLVRTTPNGTKLFPMYFIRSGDGVWRVDGM